MALRPDLAIGLPLSRVHFGAPANRCVRGVPAIRNLSSGCVRRKKITTGYAFYRGTIAALRSGGYDHGTIDVSQCEISSGTTTVTDAANGEDSYYLVAGHKNGNDGPLGHDRPNAAPQCP